MQTLISDPQSQSLIGAYHNFLKFGNASSYKAHAFTAIDGNAYKIEQKACSLLALASDSIIAAAAPPGGGAD